MPACPAFFSHFFANNKYLPSLNSISSKVGHLRSRVSHRWTSTDSSCNETSSTEARVQTEIETSEIFECVYISGKGYVPIKGRNKPYNHPDVQAVCYSGKTDMEA